MNTTEEDERREIICQIKEMRDILEEVAKRADFSQCPGLEGAVDAILAKPLPRIS